MNEAERHLQEAVRTLSEIGARFELGRTHLDLASIARANGTDDALKSHLRKAHALFTALRVPKYVERTEQLARELGARL